MRLVSSNLADYDYDETRIRFSSRTLLSERLSGVVVVVVGAFLFLPRFDPDLTALA